MTAHNFVDLTGKKFGHLTVIEKAKSNISPSGSIQARWKVVCDCGIIKTVLASCLRTGKTKSCGCRKNKDRPTTHHINIGQRFGKLVVSYLGQPYIDSRGKSQCRWVCKCDCGKTTLVAPYHLVARNHTSCGCLKESRIAIGVKEYFTKFYQATPEYKILRLPDTGYYAPYDLFISPNIFIEIQGKQHYEKDNFFHKSNTSWKKRKYTDKKKKDFAKKNGTYIEVDLRKIKTVEDAIVYIEERL
jgi:hypothetical protein